MDDKVVQFPLARTGRATGSGVGGPLLRLNQYETQLEDGSYRTRWRVRGFAMHVGWVARAIPGGNMSAKMDSYSFEPRWFCIPALLDCAEKLGLAIEPSARLLFDQLEDKWSRNFEEPDLSPIGTTLEGFAGELEWYQVDAVAYARKWRRTIIGDDMGLGKTPTALFFAELIDQWPVVSLAQPHVVSHWVEQAGIFLPERRVVVAQSGLSRAALRSAEIIVCSYNMVAAYEHEIAALRPRGILADEVQELRRPQSQKTKAARRLSDDQNLEYFVGLSGTPIYNYGIEAYEIYEAVDPGRFGTRVSFQTTYCDQLDSRLIKDPVKFGQMCRETGRLIRRTRADVKAAEARMTAAGGRATQSQFQIFRKVETVDPSNEVFMELIAAARQQAREALAMGDGFERASAEQQAMMQARQATGAAKALASALFARSLVLSGMPTIIFAHHHVVYDIILEALADLRPAQITGRQTRKEKDEHKKRFMTGETDVVLMSLRAATGVDGLQYRTRALVHVEKDWTPAVHWQGDGRVHDRRGQQADVYSYLMHVDIGTDPDVGSIQNIKAGQIAGYLGTREISVEEQRQAMYEAEAIKAEMLRKLRRGEI